MSQDDIQDLLPPLLEALETQSPARVWSVIGRLYQRGPDVLGLVGAALGENRCRVALQLLLGTDAPQPLSQSLRSLAQLGRRWESTSRLVLHYLRNLLAENKNQGASAFYLAIGECGASQSFEVLLDAKVFGDAKVRAAAAEGLGQLSSISAHFSEARLLLADMLLHDLESSVRQAAAKAMEGHLSEKDHQAILRLSMDPDPTTREMLKRLKERQGTRPAAENVDGSQRILKHYVFQFGPADNFRIFKEYERIGAHMSPEGQEDRERQEPFYTQKTQGANGALEFTLADGSRMKQLPDSTLILPLSEHDWRIRNSVTGVVTLRRPVDQKFQRCGQLTYKADGSVLIRHDSGGAEEESPDGRRVMISPLGLVQVISPRAEQGIQTDTLPELLEKQTEHAFVLLEDSSGQLILHGGELKAAPLSEGAARAEWLPYGALRVELRDGRVTREIVAGEVTHDLVGDRSVTFVPKQRSTPVIGKKTFSPEGAIVSSYQDGLEVQTTPEGGRRYVLASGEILHS